MAILQKKTLDGNVETLILVILQEGQSYGYEIIQTLNDRAAGVLKMGEGTAYPVLHRLEERELIISRWTKAQNGRKRKYYRLTPKGRRTLAQNVQQWEALVQLMQNLLGSESVGLSGVGK
ncbi:MAG: helix-turn-helix transcriptional regulator [Phycisphaerae bacterium]|nr:helix-turn-helix transcriptional regulator [Phycisphaerae bacterium]